MQASLEHAVERTTATLDQLGIMWGQDRRLYVSIHNLPHDQIHRIGRDETTYAHSVVLSEFVVTARAATPLGWEVTFFGIADPNCPRCQELRHADEAAQIAGVTE